jgi:hypothetical protein
MRVLQEAETSWVSGGETITVTPNINNQSYEPLMIDTVSVAAAMFNTGQLNYIDSNEAAYQLATDLQNEEYFTDEVDNPTATPNGRLVGSQNTDNDADGFDETAFYFKTNGSLWMFIDTNNDGLYDQRTLINYYT